MVHLLSDRFYPSSSIYIVRSIMLASDIFFQLICVEQSWSLKCLTFSKKIICIGSSNENEFVACVWTIRPIWHGRWTHGNGNWSFCPTQTKSIVYQRRKKKKQQHLYDSLFKLVWTLKSKPCQLNRISIELP